MLYFCLWFHVCILNGLQQFCLQRFLPSGDRFSLLEQGLYYFLPPLFVCTLFVAGDERLMLIWQLTGNLLGFIIPRYLMCISTFTKYLLSAGVKNSFGWVQCLSKTCLFRKNRDCFTSSLAFCTFLENHHNFTFGTMLLWVLSNAPAMTQSTLQHVHNSIKSKLIE